MSNFEASGLAADDASTSIVGVRRSDLDEWIVDQPQQAAFPSEGRGSGRPVNAPALASVLNEFAATVTSDFTLVDILRQLAVGATRVLHVDGAGVVAPGPGGELLRTVFATNELTQDLERWQEALQEGPCRSSYELGQVINLADVTTEGAWPQYQARADLLDVHAVAAVPLSARERRWGVLDLYRAEPLPFSEEELDAACTLANLATSYLVVAADRDIARHAQRELRERAMNDALTGLPVRWVFLQHLDHALARIKRAAGLVAVLFIDVDGLKYVNDTYGHAAGDRLLVACARRIGDALRPTDVLARIGGDEFVVLLEDTDQPEDALRVARRILSSLDDPYRPDGHVIRPSASIGIAATSDSATPGATLVAHADSAMYQAKQSERGGIRLFDPIAYAKTRAVETEQERLGRELQAALGANELEVHYQPIYYLPKTNSSNNSDEDTASGDVSTSEAAGDGPGMYAVEALIRWRHPAYGLLAAAAFIETAQRSGLLPQIGAFVVREACRDFSGWQQIGPHAPQRLFVNLAPVELAEPLLVEYMAAALTDAGLDPDRVTIEVTETGLMHQGSHEASSLHGLRTLGCALAVDDFGTGYSSLSRLIQIPASVIKIDRSFTTALDDTVSQPDATAVITAVHSLGRSLNRTVIAEGIESHTTLTALQELGIRHFQGFHLAVPMDHETFTDTLLTTQGTTAQAATEFNRQTGD